MPIRKLPDIPLSRSDLEGSGWTDHDIREALRRGDLRRVVRGVYVGAAVPDSIELRAAAVALVVSPYSVVCDRTAAWLHGIDAFGYADKEGPMPVETCVLRGHAPSHRQGVDGRTRDLAPRDLARIGDVVATTPLRTALDLGCALPRRRAIGVLDQFARQHGVTGDELRREVRRFRRRRGVVQLRELIPHVNGLAESMRESWVRLELLDAGLPEPVPQFWVEADGTSYRLDLAYPLHKIAIEYDGEEFHHRTEAQRLHDQDRRTWLARHGWTVIVIDKDGLGGDDLWVSEVRAALRSRTKRLRWTRTHD